MKTGTTNAPEVHVGGKQQKGEIAERELLLDAWIPGRPAAQPRPRIFTAANGSRITVSNKGAIVSWKQALHLHLRNAPIPELAPGDALEIEITAYLKPHRKYLVGQPHTKKPDWDNIAKPVADVLKDMGIIRDDNAISDGIVRKRYSLEEGILVRLRRIRITAPLARPRPTSSSTCTAKSRGGGSHRPADWHTTPDRTPGTG